MQANQQYYSPRPRLNYSEEFTKAQLELDDWRTRASELGSTLERFRDRAAQNAIAKARELRAQGDQASNSMYALSMFRDFISGHFDRLRGQFERDQSFVDNEDAMSSESSLHDGMQAQLGRESGKLNDSLTRMSAVSTELSTEISKFRSVVLASWKYRTLKWLRTGFGCLASFLAMLALVLTFHHVGSTFAANALKVAAAVAGATGWGVQRLESHFNEKMQRQTAELSAADMELAEMRKWLAQAAASTERLLVDKVRIAGMS